MFIENIGYSFISGRAGGGATTGGRSIIAWVCILKFSSIWAVSYTHLTLPTKRIL